MFLRRYEELGECFDPDEISIRPSLRINTLKSDNRILNRLEKKDVTLEKVPFLPQTYYYEAEFSLGATSEYLLGLYYLQEVASHLPCIALNPRPGDHVLDMAAAPGSKTTQMAAMMKDEGVIVALDSNVKRLASLRNNIERLGISNTVLYKKDARFAFDLGFTFDKILLDAPCSGNFCVEKDYFTTKTLPGIRDRSKLQKELLKTARKVLKTGGTLVYSTCSLEPEEDELVIDWFLKKYEDMNLVNAELPIGDEGLTEVFGEKLQTSLKHAVRLWPHKTSTQGFFVAKMVKS